MPAIRSTLILVLAAICLSACDISGPSTVLRVSVTTLGPEPDALYGVHIGGITGFGYKEVGLNPKLLYPPKPVKPNGSVSWDVESREYPVSLGGYERNSQGGTRWGMEWWPENCEIEGGRDRSVRAITGLTMAVEVTMTCS